MLIYESLWYYLVSFSRSYFLKVCTSNSLSRSRILMQVGQLRLNFWSIVMGVILIVMVASMKIVTFTSITFESASMEPYESLNRK